MIVDEIRWQAYRLPLQSGAPPGRATDDASVCGLLLCLRSADGQTGVGEYPLKGRAHPDVWDALLWSVDAGRRLLGLDLDGFRDSRRGQGLAHRKLLRVIFGDSRPPAVFAWETALLDLWGRLHNQPLVELLGGVRHPIPVNLLITASQPEPAAEQAASAHREGFNCLKCKVGRRSLADDVSLIQAVREAAGPDAKLRVDANGAWNLDQALEAVDMLAPFDIAYIEQPLPPGDLSAMTEINRRSPIPVAADEAVVSLAAAQEIVNREAASVLIVKPARVGLSEAADIVRWSQIKNIPCVLTSMIESGVGLAASAHVAGLLPPTGPPCGLATARLLVDDLLDTPLAVENGKLTLPDQPGLGIALKNESVETYGIEPQGRRKYRQRLPGPAEPRPRRSPGSSPPTGRRRDRSGPRPPRDQGGARPTPPPAG
ncbi:MAG: hypothetical protein GF355_01895 [Candidatus Eisenbacteria bacterium]|nr:hypothetical protein [Candidatus Eisenbacteria bacterium]